MTIEEIRSKSLSELVALGKEMRLEVAKLTLKKNSGVIEAGNKISSIKKTIARIETVIAEKKREATKK
ncbi:MAG: 50S ribosomal protein L29 [Chloracidobacterium sp.]|nr:50S ribosomal protein L29 [Chloracidobacterium sp.]MDW8217304.1 50S ribosomal protein L29 [Acidobacteriota bacterium]